MAFSQLPLADSMPNYIIYRDAKPGEPFDPTANLLFLPPKGSDELFDALRMTFPHLKSHSERMRQAVIQYLMEERETEQSLQTSPAMTMDSVWPAASTGCPPSVLSSPDTNNLSTPASFAPSPQLHSTELTRQASTATNASHPSPPALDQMTSVFSLSTSQQPKQRVRRKMTEAEKVEYRKRRIVKACDKCAKRKRKCPHNQAQMETLAPATASKPSSKVSKSTSPKSSKSPPSTTQQQAIFDPTILSADDINFDNSFDLESFMPMEDFPLFQDQDPFMGLNMDNFTSYDHFDPTKNYQTGDLFTPELSPMQQDWQYSDLQNAAKLDKSLSNQAQFDQTAWDSQSSSSPELYSSSGSLGRHLPLPSDQTTNIDMFSSLDSLSSANGRQQQHGRAEDLQHGGRSTCQLQSDDTSALLDHLEWGIGGEWNLQLSGTPTSRSDGLSQQNLEVQQIAFGKSKKRRVDTSGGSGDDLLWEHLRTGEPEKPVPTHTAHVHEALSGQLRASAEDTTTPQGSSKQRSQQKSLLSSSMRVSNTQTHAADYQQHVSQAGDLSQPRSSLDPASSLSENGQRGSSISTLRRKSGSRANVGIPGGSQLAAASSSVQDLTSTSVSVSSGLNSAALQGRPFSSPNERTAARQAAQQQMQSQSRHCQESEQSLGEGLPKDADPSSQLYMARKRVMSGLATNPRLQTRIILDGSRLQQEQTPTANGGAYPRLGDPEFSPSMLLSAKPAQISTGSDVSGTTTQYRDPGSAGVVQDRLNDPVCYRVHHSKQDVHEDRLHDTNKYKDHHGRAPLSSYLLLLVVGTFLLAASLLSQSVSSTALFLVFTMPYQETSQTSSLEKIVHCTTKNSRWLSSAFASLTETKFGLAVPSFEKRGWYWPGLRTTWLEAVTAPRA